MRFSEDQKWAANLQPTLNKWGGEGSLTIFVTDVAANINVITSEKWFDVEIDSEQNENLLKALTTNFITRNFETQRIAIKEGHGYKLSNLYKKLEVFK